LYFSSGFQKSYAINC